MHSTVIVCSAILVLLTLALALWTSIRRTSSNIIAYGTPLDPASAMAKAQRAHGNAAEYAGLLIGLFLIVGLAYEGRDLGALVTWTMIAVTLSRIVHAIGFLVCATLEKPHLLKVTGSVVTYIGGALLAVQAIGKSL